MYQMNQPAPKFQNARKNVKQDTTYPILDVLSLAFAAHRVNQGYSQVGESVFDHLTGGSVTKKYANKDIVKFQITGRYIPSNYTYVAVKEEDIQKAKNAKSHFEKYMFNILGGDISEFTQNILDVIFKEEVTKHDLGLISYIPEMIARDNKKDKLGDILDSDYCNSKHVGKPKDRFEGKITILNNFFARTYNCWIYTAGCDGNLFTFFNKKQLELGKEYNVRAKINWHGYNRVNNSLQETALNYLKFV